MHEIHRSAVTERAMRSGARWIAALLTSAAAVAYDRIARRRRA